MSLINQMLKELETRRIPPVTGVGVGKALPGRGRRNLTLPLFGLVLLLAVALAYLLWRQNAMTTSAPAGAAPQIAAVPQPASPAPAPTAVSGTPQPATTVITPKPREAVAPRPATLSVVTPGVVEGGWQPRTLTLRGEGLRPGLSLLVAWDDREKLLGPEQVEWVDETTARITLVTGNSGGVWRVSLIGADGSRGEAVRFEVLASAVQPVKGERVPAAVPQMEKVIHPPTTGEQADRLYHQGYLALQQQQPSRTDTLWQQALKVEPLHLPAREGLIALYLSQGRRVEATPLLQQGTALHPENGNLALLHARMQAEDGDSVAALATLERAMGGAEQQGAIHALAAAIYQQRGDYAMSVKAYQRALQLEPQQANWWMGAGISLEGAGKQGEARSAYQEALQRGGLGGESKRYVQQRLLALD